MRSRQSWAGPRAESVHGLIIVCVCVCRLAVQPASSCSTCKRPTTPMLPVKHTGWNSKRFCRHKPITTVTRTWVSWLISHAFAMQRVQEQGRAAAAGWSAELPALPSGGPGHSPGTPLPDRSAAASQAHCSMLYGAHGHTGTYSGLSFSQSWALEQSHGLQALSNAAPARPGVHGFWGAANCSLGADGP